MDRVLCKARCTAASLHGDDDLFWLKTRSAFLLQCTRWTDCETARLRADPATSADLARAIRPSVYIWLKMGKTNWTSGRRRAREGGGMVQKVLLSSLPPSVGVEVLMTTRNKTKRPSVTRPNRAHYNNSFNRTPSSYSLHEL